jgi:hypothetical protein
MADHPGGHYVKRKPRKPKPQSTHHRTAAKTMHVGKKKVR